MATNENLIPIPGRLHSVATEGHVAGADEIFDDAYNGGQGATQSDINAEVAEAIGTGGSVDSRIAAAINALDSSKSQSAGADGLALNVVEENGKITSISGSIASNTYDAYGAASSEQSVKYKVATSGVRLERCTPPEPRQRRRDVRPMQMVIEMKDGQEHLAVFFLW